MLKGLMMPWLSLQVHSIGVIGFCWGGRYATILAGIYPLAPLHVYWFYTWFLLGSSAGKPLLGLRAGKSLPSCSFWIVKDALCRMNCIFWWVTCVWNLLSCLSAMSIAQRARFALTELPKCFALFSMLLCVNPRGTVMEGCCTCTRWVKFQLLRTVDMCMNDVVISYRSGNTWRLVKVDWLHLQVPTSAFRCACVPMDPGWTILS